MWRLGVVAVVVVVVVQCGGVDWAQEEAAKQLLESYQKEAEGIYNNNTQAAWNYKTNITEETRRKQEEAAERSRVFRERWNERSRDLADRDLTPETKRLLKKVFQVQLGEEDAKKLTMVKSEMSTIYSTGEVCLDEKGCLGLFPNLTDIMANSRNYSELKEVWQQWRATVGRGIRPHYLAYLELKNKEARLNNFTDAGERWREQYESPSFEEEAKDLYKDLEGLYRLLHAYVRKRLREEYGEEIDLKGPLPACVLGDMWGRFWTNIAPLVTPYPSRPPLDVTPALKALNHSPETLFQMGDSFFTSMGLKPVPDTFWTRSMLTKPEDRDVSCHPTAWDFYDGKDFRIKMCTQVTLEDLQIIHHELGHVQYFMQYAHLPLAYRDGANNGFHEAVGELLGLVMSTPQHLARKGLLDRRPDSLSLSHSLISRSHSNALQSLTPLPFHLSYDLWRWQVWRGEVEEEEYNDLFWRLRLKYSGVVPPVARTPLDLDPPALFHVSHDYDTIRYFIRTILQFQFLEALCEVSGHTGPLHECDLYGSEAAGSRLAEGLALGSSVPWPRVLEVLTGSTKMSGNSLRRYFKPLEEWLTRQDLEHVGWEEEEEEEEKKEEEE
ncbi:LOW QUALITY PROTEIN: angiotensin-converting enzyme-like, partial [Eriocheir sinensis]|uniref:LOW QUALITY PROTEIN: angiotensin-converting enzyme-like n=1 Tax=Eriocheir sinensis TaxID=95602 RepID=UPI0021C8F7B4